LAIVILVCATNTGVGKTTASVLLLKTFAKLGLKVVGFKPIETGVDGHPQDGTMLLNASNVQGLDIDDICPLQYKMAAAPYIAKGANNINWQKINDAFDKLYALSDVLIIESAGGLLSPIEQGIFNIDLFKKLNSNKLLLICNSTLGCLSDAVVHSQMINLRDIPFLICVNRRKDDNFEELSLPFWNDFFGSCLELERDILIIANKLL
jgi:dethiobiotin synthetase